MQGEDGLNENIYSESVDRIKLSEHVAGWSEAGVCYADERSDQCITDTV